MVLSLGGRAAVTHCTVVCVAVCAAEFWLSLGVLVCVSQEK